LRKLEAIAKKAEVEGAALHRFRKTYANTLHEEGVSVRGVSSEFVLACDMRFASRKNTRLGHPEVGVGLHPKRWWH
jgi:hypothetical protein